jgi:molecular chaperone IbpA
MRTYDLPALRRSTVGFEHLLNRMNDAPDDVGSYPLYDVERAGENQYRIWMALPGFTTEDIAVTAEPAKLTVEGLKAKKGDGDFLYRGISMRPFRRVFNLAEHVQVKDASFENGMLRIVLVHEVPEATKPRRIVIGVAGNDNPNIDHSQAA